ncbi:hypothetical protein O181_080061 [Austropuccinia psidii MF-1]|uniref:Uncharacterized protein n=1 Tax=Austropuccinia psidii MF-1 TaxID=1389203 RepID=A0A9Q3FHH5_9BASI|nr:hypothetical protein [Austropuccinia psidii MF-1]
MRGQIKRVVLKTRSLNHWIQSFQASSRLIFQKASSQEEQEGEDKTHAALLNKDNKLINPEKGRRIKESLCTYCGKKQTIEKCFKRPQNRPESSKASLARRENPEWES